MEKKASWLELFYDLIFVAAFIQLGDGLSKHVGIGGFASFSAIVAMLWIVWTGFAFYSNRFNVNDFVHRIVVFVQMFAIGAMAITAPDVLSGKPHRFAMFNSIALFSVALMYWRAWLQVESAQSYGRYWGRVFFVGGTFWFASVFVPAPWCYGLWFIGMAEILVSPFSKFSRALEEQFPIDREHLSERYGILTIIVLGESFVKVISSLSGDGASLFVVGQAMFVLLITCCIWWIYFDDVAGSELKKKPMSPLIWLYMHLPLQIAVIAVGVALKKAVFFDLSAVVAMKYRWLLCGSLAITFFSVAMIDSVTERRQAELSDKNRVFVRFASAAIILLLAAAGGVMSGMWFLTFVTIICVAQVLFDMMMAPLEAIPEHSRIEPTTTAELALRRQQGTTTVKPSLSRVGEAIQKGAPSELRRDLYFYFIEGSWTRVFAVLIFMFLLTNVVFAMLYVLQPGCIDAVRANSLADAFYFSVQTMSTIGYGVMAPATAYGHTIVTIEAAVGLIGVALATGLMFAKASRPRNSVLFSDTMVISKQNGRPVLVFRAGNARGNDIVDATMTVSVLRDEFTPEGHHIRRIHDLKLARQNSPFFSLTWVLMHEIDADSPLYDVDWDNPHDHLVGVIVTLVGHDGTYGQTIYARHLYSPDEIKPDRRFVDVLSQLDDGRLMVDYTKFHDTIEDQSAS